MNKTKKVFIILVILLLASAGAVYWYMFFYGPGNTLPTEPTSGTFPVGGFSPIGGNNSTSSTNTNGFTTIPTDQTTEPNLASTTQDTTKTPGLRLLSDTPVGGYGASTTASTTVVRWVDRGRGNVYETKMDSVEINTLSNTILPKVYESFWNKNLTSFIGTTLQNNDVLKFVYAQLVVQATSTAKQNLTNATNTEPVANGEQNITPYSLKGKNLPENILDYAISPKGDKLFMYTKELGQGAGYISNLDGTSLTKIFVSPLTQITVEWPEENTLAINTKGSATQNGFLYFVNTKTGIWKKVLGPITGLSTKVSKDAKYILASGTGKNSGIVTNIYTVGTTTPKSATVKTLADKCVWGNFYKEIVYCAEPTEYVSGTYPDDWYKGIISLSDRIWQINAKNMTIDSVTPVYDEADRLIDAFNMSLDAKDSYLFFQNKRDLSFWSFDLSKSH